MSRFFARPLTPADDRQPVAVANGCKRRAVLAVALAPGLLALQARPAGAANPMTLDFLGTRFEHRWSKAGQHEFTPPGETDLQHWHDMLTLNVHASAHDGDALAGVANNVLANYQRHGKVLQTRSTPRAGARPAEHLIVAVLGQPTLLEAVWARCLLHEGSALVTVVSHRIHGAKVGPAMSDWLRGNGARLEQGLMAWSGLPHPASLAQLPTSP